MRIVVLGGGPGGYSAAFEAARLGAEVVLVERDRLGGTCLNWGCIPAKAILRSARLVHDARNAEGFGVRVAEARADIRRVIERKDAVVDELRAQLESAARRLRVEVVRGEGRLSSAKVVEVALADGGSASYEGDAVILATGSVVFKLPNIDHSLPGVWTSDDAVHLPSLPSHVVLIGGGVIGLEFACALSVLGSAVTVVELTPSVLPGNDKRVQREAQKALEALGVAFRLGTSVQTVEQDGETMRSTLSDGEVLESDIVFSAVGRAPNGRGFGFEETGIEMDRAAVLADPHFRTSVPGVYAIGDLIGGMMLAHVAEEEGVLAARNAVADLAGEGQLESMDYDSVPACLYTFPEVGVVGHTRDGAKERGLDAVVAVAKLAGNAKALAEGEAEGFAQLVVENGTGRILGAQILGPHAVEIVHEVSVAMRNGVGARALAATVHAHPTMSEVIRVAAAEGAAKAGV